MLTWLRLWSVFAVPVIAVFLSGLLPTRIYQGIYFGGGPIREFALNTFLLSILNPVGKETLITWFLNASFVEEYLLYSVIMLNLSFLMSPFFYAVGQSLIKSKNWLSVTNLVLKRKAAR